MSTSLLFSGLKFHLYHPGSWDTQGVSYSIKKFGGKLVDLDGVDKATMILLEDAQQQVGIHDKIAFAGQFYLMDAVQRARAQNSTEFLEKYKISFGTKNSDKRSAKRVDVEDGDVEEEEEEQEQEQEQDSPKRRESFTFRASTPPVKRQKKKKQQKKKNKKKSSTPSRGESYQGSKGVRAARMRYTEQDDGAILRYVDAAPNDTQISGNSFWKEMEENEVLPGRSFQSMRDRYLKHLRNASKKEQNRLKGLSPAKSKKKKKRKTLPIKEEQEAAPPPEVSLTKPKRRKISKLSQEERGQEVENTVQLPDLSQRSHKVLEMIQKASKELDFPPSVICHCLFSVSGDVRKMYKMLTRGEGLGKNFNRWSELNLVRWTWEDSKMFEDESDNADVGKRLEEMFVKYPDEFRQHAIFKDPTNPCFQEANM